MGKPASVYKQYPPLVNATKGPNQWQTYGYWIYGNQLYDKSGGRNKAWEVL